MGARLCCCRNLARPSSCPLGYPAGVSAAVAIKREARRKHKPKRAEIMMPEKRSAEAARQDRAWSLVAQDRQNESQTAPISMLTSPRQIRRRPSCAPADPTTPQPGPTCPTTSLSRAAGEPRAGPGASASHEGRLGPKEREGMTESAPGRILTTFHQGWQRCPSWRRKTLRSGAQSLACPRQGMCKCG